MRTLKIATLTLAALLPIASHAHKAWLLPSATVSTVDQWITVDAAVSNDLFYFNHNPLRTDGLSITAPHKSAVLDCLDWIEPEAQEMGAVNTIVVDDDKLRGFNTDAAGFIEPLLALTGSLDGSHGARKRPAGPRDSPTTWPATACGGR